MQYYLYYSTILSILNRVDLDDLLLDGELDERSAAALSLLLQQGGGDGGAGSAAVLASQHHHGPTVGAYLLLLTISRPSKKCLYQRNQKTFERLYGVTAAFVIVLVKYMHFGERKVIVREIILTLHRLVTTTARLTSRGCGRRASCGSCRAPPRTGGGASRASTRWPASPGSQTSPRWSAGNEEIIFTQEQKNI